MEPIWLKHYPPGVQPHIRLKKTQTLVTMFTEACTQYADRAAFSCEGETITFRELSKRVDHLSAYFQQELKLKKGDHVAIMLPNILQYPVALFAILKSGCVAVNLNPLDKAGNLLHQLKDSGAKVILVIENFISELQQVVDQTSIEHVMVTSFGDMFHPIKGKIVDFIMCHVKHLVPKWHLEHCVRYKDALKIGASLTFQSVKIAQKDTALLQYTGGTTGFAKAAILSHKNMVSNLIQSKMWTDEILGYQNEIIVTALPLYHIFSLLANCLLFIHRGAENILIPNPRDVKHMVATIRRRRYTGLTGVNTLFSALLKNQDFRERSDFSGLKLVLAGGMAMQASIAEDWQKVTGVGICQAYGMTETSPAITMNLVKGTEYNGSVGFPIPDTEVSVRDGEGSEVPLGEKGELWVRGPQVMQSYWNREEESKKVLVKDGWLRTGDVARMDDRGLVFLVDRLKDIIVVSGFKVYPAEIENCIRTIPGVAEVAVVGIACEIKGEEVKAFIVKTNPYNPTADEVRAYCKKKLAAYKVPNQVTFVPELPKSNVGKILKRELKKI